MNNIEKILLEEIFAKSKILMQNTELQSKPNVLYAEVSPVIKQLESHITYCEGNEHLAQYHIKARSTRRKLVQLMGNAYTKISKHLKNKNIRSCNINKYINKWKSDN